VQTELLTLEQFIKGIPAGGFWVCPKFYDPETKRLESKAMEGVFDVNVESEKEDKLRSHSKSVNKLVKELEDMKIS
jgi:hypothetical protein